MERLFGPGATGIDGPIERLIEASGGNIRSLLMLLREVLARATTLPVGKEAISRVIQNRRESFGLMSNEDARMLSAIGAKQDIRIEEMDAARVERLSHFLNETMVMFFRNGHSWFDTHPMIRADAARLAGPAPAA